MEREGQRKRQTDKHTHTQREIDRHTETDTVTDTERQVEWQREEHYCS